jgi:hypothetical protein
MDAALDYIDAMIAGAPGLPRAIRAAPALATLAAAILLGTVVIYWLWRWLGPAPVHVIAAEPRDPVAAIAASGWLAAPAPVPATAAATPSTLGGDVRLLGVMADTRGGGYALFRLPGGPKIVAEGGEIARGSVLERITPFAILVRDASGERSILLRADTTSKAPLAQSVAAATLRNSPACAPPPGFRGSVVKLNAELLQGLASQPDALAAIVTPVAGGGMSVREGSGFAQMIGMKPGDRVRLANGIPLANADDVMAAVVTPLIANQPVRLSGTRDGTSQEMLLLNAGACPG